MTRKYVPYAIKQGLLVPGEAEATRAVCNAFVHEVSRVDEAGVHMSMVRMSQIEQSAFDSEIRQQVWLYAEHFNKRYWRLALHKRRLGGGGWMRSIIYRKGGYFLEHNDYEPCVNDFVKVTAIIALNDEYEGGGMTIYGRPLPRLRKGDVLYFPSYSTHAIKTVTSGERHVLALFYTGPPYV